MTTFSRVTLLLCLLVSTANADEQVVTPQIESVGLFKNGLAVVRVAFPVTGPGQYRWDKVPRVVHGTFWVESDGELAIQSTSRKVDQPEEAEFPTGVTQTDLEGKKVTVTLKSVPPQTPQVLTGTVWKMPQRSLKKTWDTQYSSVDPFAGGWYGARYANSENLPRPPASSTGTFLVLEDGTGARQYVDHSTIAGISVAGPFLPKIKSEDRPVLLFDVQKAPANGGQIRISYLTKGLAWVPSYQVDLTNPTQLTLRQNGLVRNELMDLKNTEVQLISGFPNIKFAHVDSPLWPGASLSGFFQQLNQSPRQDGSSMMMNQMAYNSASRSSEGNAIPDVAENGNTSGDIHYESIGKRQLGTGDSLSMEIASGKAAYERVVEWVVPDQRDEYGRFKSRNGGRQETQDDQDQAWDAVRFNNPLKFPMTTGSALVVEGGRFRGQSMSSWVNPGQQTCLRITKALSVRTEASEQEEEGGREDVSLWGNTYQRIKVKSLFKLQNFRSKEVTMLVKGQFSGTLLEADGDPKKSLRSEGIVSVNPQREVAWTVKVPAGEEKVINWRYSVLVRR